VLSLKEPPGMNATVTLCHTGTKRLDLETRRAEVLVVAAGIPRGITANMITPDAVVIDVGTNKGPDGKLVGDVDFEHVRNFAGAITPVPGGVGPMTVAMLMSNVVSAAERAAERAATGAPAAHPIEPTA
jgi:methylenetetrahydrofolate dehydrogenase (NADP+)/methenyltetrahydrofolate cyclohydrolase